MSPYIHVRTCAVFGILPFTYSYIQFKVCVNQVIYDQWVGSELSYVSVKLQVNELHN